MRCDNLFLWYLGDDAPRHVGALNLVASGKGVSLRYGTEWLRNGFPLSEDLPLEDAVFFPAGRLESKHPRAAGAVDDARPDRWGEKVIRFIDKPARMSLMEFLYYAGDDRFGALGVSTSASRYTPKGRGPLPRLKDAQTLSEVVAKVQEGESLSDIESQIIAGGGTPLGGAKPKALIVIDGEQWVIKFFNGEPVDSPLVEHASMTLAAKAGINVAQTKVIAVAGLNAIVIRRFDRNGDKRFHCISAGTAIRASTASGQDPEMGYPQLARILRRAGVSENDANSYDARELFKRMVFNILIDNTDDHEKNHSLLVVNPGVFAQFRLAPAYDVLPSNSGQGLQEFICGDDLNDSTLANAMTQTQAFGLTQAQAAVLVVEVIAIVNTWRSHFSALGVSETDIESLAERIDGDKLKPQRDSFDPREYQQARKRPSRRSPFQQKR
jgi:serine/threonine-protein kinase HipA